MTSLMSRATGRAAAVRPRLWASPPARAMIAPWNRARSARARLARVLKRRGPRPQGRYRPRLVSIWVSGPFWLLVVFWLLVWVYRWLRRIAFSPWPWPVPQMAVSDPKDALQAAAGIVAVAGAVLTGVYAYRKQRLDEGDARRADAVEFSRRYAEAAGQLGDDKAPVRLAGAYAMARLADEWPEERQTCVSVLCAYLRMPPPCPRDERARAALEPAARAAADQEDQVRDTVQRLLQTHLQKNAPISWSACDIDLTGAHLHNARFDGATFSGDAGFVGATFSGDTGFAEATFSRVAWFDGATFSGDTGFAEATFSGDAWFDGATFSGDTGFAEATFSGVAWFDGATFSGDAQFGRATFSRIAWFDRATFSKDAWFDGATFSGDAQFNRATFSKDAWFDGATFSGNAQFGRATFSGNAQFGRATFSGGAGFDEAHFLRPPSGLVAEQLTGARVDDLGVPADKDTT